MDKFQLLKRYWGFSKFRPYQKEIIDSLLEGKDVIGILPTGIGKSLCYQLPSLIMDGPVLVISPLVALMIDQVRQLGKQGIKSMYFENDLKGTPLQQQIENSIYGNYKFIKSQIYQAYMPKITGYKSSYKYPLQHQWQGNWGYVYKGLDIKTKEDVVLKFIDKSQYTKQKYI